MFIGTPCIKLIDLYQKHASLLEGHVLCSFDRFFRREKQTKRNSKCKNCILWLL